MAEMDYEEEDGEERLAALQEEYYTAKDLMHTDVPTALRKFLHVVELESTKGEWGFKATKRVVKIYSMLGEPEHVVEYFQDMLEYVKAAGLTQSYSNKSLCTILDVFAQSRDLGFVHKVYETLLNMLYESRNEWLWFKVLLRLGNICLDGCEYLKLSKIIRDFHTNCRRSDGGDDTKRGAQLLEVYALEAQMYSATKNNKKLHEVCQKSQLIKSGAPHSTAMAIIKEYAGKLRVSTGEWEKAFSDFLDAIKHTAGAAGSAHVRYIKYLILVQMLGFPLFVANAMDIPEVKIYESDPGVILMTNLLHAHSSGDVMAFKRIMEDKDPLLTDPFLQTHLTLAAQRGLMKRIQQFVVPFTRVKVSLISQELGISSEEVETLLMALILDIKIAGRIDQAGGVLLMETQQTPHSNHKGL